MPTIEQRVRELLASHPADAPWRRRAIDLGTATTSRAIFEQHPRLHRLRDLDEGWLDRPRGVRVDDIYPALRGERIALLVDLELIDEAYLDESGPHSDFDPLNSVIFARVPVMGYWYSLVCLPGEPMTRWPVVQCDPAGRDDSVMTVAVNVEHFMHQLMCRDEPLLTTPLVDASEPVAAEVIRVMGAVFNINAREATALLASRRPPPAGRSHDPAALSSPGPCPYIDELRRLDRLAVLPE